jgi:hypothetical protein
VVSNCSAPAPEFICQSHQWHDLHNGGNLGRSRLGFSRVGAWPVTGFLGLDVVLLYFALHWNNRTGRAYEFINLTDNALTIEKTGPWGQQKSWSF